MKAEDELNDMKKELFLKKLKDDSIKEFEITLSLETLNKLINFNCISRDIKNKTFEYIVCYIKIKISIFGSKLYIEKMEA